MSRLAVLLVAFAVGGCASAPRSANAPRIDGSSEAAFTQSVASLRKTLNRERSTFVVIALQDIWRTTEIEAAPGSRDADKVKAYFARVDGLGYNGIISLADATPPTVREQYQAMIPRAPRPTPYAHYPQHADNNTNAGFGGYGAYGALIGMPQYSTSCGSVCSR